MNQTSQILLIFNNYDEISGQLEEEQSKLPCKYFLRGACKFGFHCRYSHVITKREDIPCRFYFSNLGCTKGSKREFSHGKSSVEKSIVKNQVASILRAESFSVEQMTSNRYHLFLCNSMGHVVSIPNEKLRDLVDGSFEVILDRGYMLSDDRIKQVSSASDPFIGTNTFFLSMKGVCYSQGSNAGGQLGLNHEADALWPTRIPAKFFKSEGTIHETVIKISAGNGHSAFLAEEGSVYTCGLSEHGQLGLGDYNRRAVPTKVNITKIIDVQCGSDHTVCLTHDGTVYGFGKTSRGQLGIVCQNTRISTPTQIFLPERVIQISTKSDHSAFLTEKGCVYMCGNNNFGQCSNFGLNHIKEKYIPTPRKLQFPEKIINVFCCDYSTAIVTRDNDIYMFGDNDYQTISSSNQIITKANNHQSLYTPTKLDFLKQQVITRDWKVDYICTTYMSKEIVILLNSNSQHRQRMAQELHNKQLNNIFTDVDVICYKDS